MTERLPSGADSAVAAADLRWMRFDRARGFSWAQTIGIIVLLAVIFATPGFLAKPSILSFLTTVSFIGCVAIGMTLIIMPLFLSPFTGLIALIALGSEKTGFVNVNDDVYKVPLEAFVDARLM